MVGERKSSLVHQTGAGRRVAGFVGSGKSKSRDLFDGMAGYRDGHGKENQLRLNTGTINLLQRRFRNIEIRSKSQILRSLILTSKELSELIPELFLPGLAKHDFVLVLGRL